MTCSSVDLKAFALGEPCGGPGEAAHIESCESCREELERLRVTQTALLALPGEEIPQRIAFVSDKIFEPHWWQWIWRSGPAMGFASAVLVAAAIFASALARPVTVVQSAAGIGAAQVEHMVAAEVDRRVALQVAKVAAESQMREAKAVEMLNAAEKRFELQRQSDIAMMQQAARYWENKMGQLMVASNRNYGGAQ
jgi:hypothetical protein